MLERGQQLKLGAPYWRTRHLEPGVYSDEVEDPEGVRKVGPAGPPAGLSRGRGQAARPSARRLSIALARHLDRGGPPATPPRPPEFPDITLADPALNTWPPKAVEHRREHVEAHLSASAQTVSWVTERRSSPHALVLTKDPRSRDLQVAQRQRDLEALPRLAAAQPA